MKNTQYIIGYHFTGYTLRNGDPIPPIGVWIKHKGQVMPCESGLHASEHPFDALQYAPGNNIHLVILRGNLISHGNPIDKWVGQQRLILSSVNAENDLRQFARRCALDVVQLWDCPAVVRKYLETGNQSIRAAALAAARDAARAAAWNAAWNDARAAAWNAAWNKYHNEFKLIMDRLLNTKSDLRDIPKLLER